ncbi:hypothetical protein ACIQYS_01340 [Psychrobacillus sp. NPDC096426]|uniref:hypothetical protein n=1 Tax=Psychrobacillus sp. NPDC096426 TaxID=3364491 RepID=UPI00382CB16E
MNQKKFFSNNLRDLISLVGFFLLIFIWASLSSEDYSVLFKIFVALFVTGIYTFVRWALN